jgi:hypothetical protein
VPNKRREVRLSREEDVPMAVGVGVRVLRLAPPTRIGDRATPHPTRNLGREIVPRLRRDLRVPAHPRPAQPMGHPLRAGVDPRHHARTGPTAVPATTLASLADRAGRPCPSPPRPRRSRLHRAGARRKTRRRHHLHSHLGRLAVSITYVESDGGLDLHRPSPAPRSERPCRA